MSDILRNLRTMQRLYEKKALPATARMYGEAANEIERLREALEASQELLVTSLHYDGNEYFEDTHKQIAVNRALLGPIVS